MSCAVSRSMREHLDGKKQENKDAIAEKAAARETLMEPTRRQHGMNGDFSKDENDCEEEITLLEMRQLDIVKLRSIRDLHEYERGRGRSEVVGSSRGIGFSDRDEFYKSYNVGDASKEMKQKSVFKKKKTCDMNINEMDSSIDRYSDCTQQKGKSYGKVVVFSNVLPHATTNPYYGAMTDEIARAGIGVKGPSPYAIPGTNLDNQIEDIKEYVEAFKKKWKIYSVTVR